MNYASTCLTAHLFFKVAPPLLPSQKRSSSPRAASQYQIFPSPLSSIPPYYLQRVLLPAHRPVSPTIMPLEVYGPRLDRFTGRLILCLLICT
jgi:hypothetical protein